MLDRSMAVLKVSLHQHAEHDRDHALGSNWAQHIYIRIDREAGDDEYSLQKMYIKGRFTNGSLLSCLRFSTAGSTHNLSNCYDTSDNWTDNDMEIYMTRNATARTGLVPLWGRLFVSWYVEVLLYLNKALWHISEYDRQHRHTPIVAQDNLLFFVSLCKTSKSSD